MSGAVPQVAAGAAGSAAPTPSAGAQPVTPGAGATTTSTQPMSNQNLNQIVTDYLLKRGFTKTEHVFRQESSHLGPDGRPIHTRVEDKGPAKYRLSINNLKEWVEGSLDVYKFELSKLLWPVFVYSWMELINQGYVDESKNFVKTFTPLFENAHASDLKTFSTITLPQQLKENSVTTLYRENKYHIPLNMHVVGSLFNFLERESDNGGQLITNILQTSCSLDTTARGPIEPFSFEAIYRRSQGVPLEEIDQHEGIPGVATGVLNKDVLDKNVALRLGPLPMDEELRDDVRADLADEDQRNPPPEGKPTLVDEFEQRIKREESADVASRADLPLPPPRARDVAMEMAKVRENRDRFKIEGRTGGLGVPVSACMFTFHNSLGSVSCMDFSRDHELVAVGTTDSYIRVWHMEGKALKTKVPHEKDLRVSNRKLIGHSGPVYSVAFSDGVASNDGATPGDLGPKLLLSASADGHIRLWSLELWTCLCIYKGHDGPVFRVSWGPHGHYFLSGGWDKTARVWMQDHASAQRLLVGHDTSLSAIAWHPNGTYVFTASDETDKSIRMWSVVTGGCVRVLTGHADFITSLRCAPNGRLLASADAGGSIFFWDIEKGTRIKRSRGHAKGGIWDLDFSVESNILVSGGQDGTVRLWDVDMPAEGHKAAAGAQPAPATEGDNTTQNQNQAQQQAASGAGTGGANAQSAGKKKGKEVMVTPDQISAFATKKTPVMTTQFTRMNLVVVGGCYDPER